MSFFLLNLAYAGKFIYYISENRSVEILIQSEIELHGYENKTNDSFFSSCRTSDLIEFERIIQMIDSR